MTRKPHPEDRIRIKEVVVTVLAALFRRQDAAEHARPFSRTDPVLLVKVVLAVILGIAIVVLAYWRHVLVGDA